MIIGAYTDKGKAREINEDSYDISGTIEPEGCFCIVADGMGGHNAGEVASKVAIDEIRDNIENSYHKDMSEQQISSLLNDSMEKANMIIYKKSMQDDKYAGMGTTATVCLIHKNQIFVAHVGDSRAYLIRNNEITQITKDHSMVEELIHSGSITREEAANHPKKNVITRALGCEENTRIDIYIYECRKKDKILICTDGLTNMLSDEKILDVIESSDSMQSAVERLVAMSNEKGGLDNITAVALSL